MEYVVNFKLAIYNSDKTRACFGHKTMTLPFPPFIGLRLQEKMSNDPITDVSWSNEHQEFTCHIKRYEEIMDDGSMLDMEFLVDLAKQDGWLGLNRTYDIE